MRQLNFNMRNIESNRNTKQDIAIARIEERISNLGEEINQLKALVNNHLRTMTDRITFLENEIRKRWSRPEAIGIGLLMSLVSALLIYVITNT